MTGYTNRLQNSLPHLCLVIWLVFIAYAVWQHAKSAELPPMYDALSYLQKAKNFWNAVGRKEIFNPLNVEPTLRPPGTVLMSYPFGFDADFRGFYFRSVFLPIVLLVAAVYVVGYAKRMSEAQRWDLALIVMCLSALPMFYYFEFPEGVLSFGPWRDRGPLYWGLVDNFLAGVAALAAASTVRSVRAGSPAWLVTAAGLASLCLLIKPAGMAVMALVGAGWLCTSLLELRASAADAVQRKKVLRRLGFGVAALSLICGGVLYASLSSKYFSPQNVSFGKAALTVAHSDWADYSASRLFTSLRQSFGVWLPLGGVAIGVLTYVYRHRLNPESLGWTKAELIGLAAGALLALSIGVAVWLGILVTQVRYFFPFALMAVVCLVPFAMLTMDCAGPLSRMLLRWVCAISAVGFALLIVQRQPPVEWQELAGVTLSSGGYKDEVRQAKALISEARAERRNARVYSFFSGAATGAFEAVGAFESFLSPDQPNFSIVRPLDWQRPTAFRLSEILDSDYILFQPVHSTDAKDKALSLMRVETFEDQSRLFHAWFSNLSDKDGVKTVAETRYIRLLRITDRALLEESLAELESRYSWTPAFKEANARRWWGEGDLRQVTQRHPELMSGVHFGDLFAIRAFSIDRASGELIATVWWEPLRPNLERNWHFYVHLLGRDGNLLYSAETYLSDRRAPKADQRIRRSVLKLKNSLAKAAKEVAFGIYQPPEVACLRADKGTRDWGGCRVRIALPALARDRPFD